MTRVLVTRHPTVPTSLTVPTNSSGSTGSTGPDGDEGSTNPHPSRTEEATTPTPGDDQLAATLTPGGNQDLTTRLRAAMALLPPVLGGAASQPLDAGRASRVVQPAQRAALAIRDGGCVFPDCDRPLAWCDAHHLVHWLDGGPTDLANLALLCRTHHRAVHEGGWQLQRDPDGRLTATPPHRPHPPHRRRRPAA